MATGVNHVFEAQLRERRERLQRVEREGGPRPELLRLLSEVDAALERLGAGTFGLCDSCHGTIEADRLAADPLLRLCVEHMSETERGALEDDLRLARKIQAALLPAVDLQLPGWELRYRYEPLGAVSGDICDVLAGAAGEFHLLLGDVAGKGVAAALLMANLHAIFRTLAGAGLTPEALMERANHLFCEATLPNSYATLVGAHGSADGRLRLCNAGHCPPLLVRAGRVEAVPAGGLPLGLFCGGSYVAQALTLEPGELLLLYTDGLTEAENRAGEAFGVERLQALLERLPAGVGAQRALEATLSAQAAFVQGAPRRDDLTVVALVRNPVPAS